MGQPPKRVGCSERRLAAVPVPLHNLRGIGTGSAQDRAFRQPPRSTTLPPDQPTQEVTMNEKPRCACGRSGSGCAQGRFGRAHLRLASGPPDRRPEGAGPSSPCRFRPARPDREGRRRRRDCRTQGRRPFPRQKTCQLRIMSRKNSQSYQTNASKQMKQNNRTNKQAHEPT